MQYCVFVLLLGLLHVCGQSGGSGSGSGSGASGSPTRRRRDGTGSGSGSGSGTGTPTRRRRDDASPGDTIADFKITGKLVIAGVTAAQLTDVDKNHIEDVILQKVGWVCSYSGNQPCERTDISLTAVRRTATINYRINVMSDKAAEEGVGNIKGEPWTTSIQGRPVVLLRVVRQRASIDTMLILATAPGKGGNLASVTSVIATAVKINPIGVTLPLNPSASEGSSTKVILLIATAACIVLGWLWTESGFWFWCAPISEEAFSDANFPPHTKDQRAEHEQDPGLLVTYGPGFPDYATSIPAFECNGQAEKGWGRPAAIAPSLSGPTHREEEAWPSLCFDLNGTKMVVPASDVDPTTTLADYIRRQTGQIALK